MRNALMHFSTAVLGTAKEAEWLKGQGSDIAIIDAFIFF